MRIKSSSTVLRPNMRSTLEDGTHGYSKRDSAAQAIRAELPCLFSFSSPRIHTRHQEDDVSARRNVEELEEEEPGIREVLERRCPQ